MKAITTEGSETESKVSDEPKTIVVRKGSKAATLIALVVLGAITAVGGYVLMHSSQTKDSGAAKRDKAPPVTVAQAVSQNVPIEVRTIGNVLSYSVVNVVPQVSGQLTKVTFTQGQVVKKGDLLYQIDPRPYQAALQQAQGNVAKDVALVNAARANLAKDTAQVGLLQATVGKDVAAASYAKDEMKRYASLVNQGAVSHEQSEQMTTNAATSEQQIEADKKAVENAQQVLNADKAAIATAQGTLEADRAAASNASIQLGWTEIRSPLDGRTGSLNVYEGNVVQANQTTPLVTIDQVQPIYIQFTLPEQNLDQIRRAITDKTLKVAASIEGQKADSVEGTVSFLQNTVDTTSGTVSMRATFANTRKKLFPGQFVDVVVTMPSDGATVVVPATALQTSQQGNSVYVVQADNTVKFVTVDLKRTYGNLAAIGKGLNPGDIVVTDGQLQLNPGMKVSVQRNSSGMAPQQNAGAPPSESQ